jgi:thioesterase domain-containing protein/acyl carrier protein
VVNFYGQTEIFSVACFEVPVGWNDGPTVPIGRASTGVEVHLLDADLRPVPAGTPGEVYAAGGWTAVGYLNDPDATAAKFPPNPFGPGRLCRTGDVGRLEPDGTLVLTGRGDRMLKIRGQRVEPGEVEAHLLTHPDVEAAAVVGQSDDAGETRLVAFVVAKPGATPDASALRRFVARALPSAMVPSALTWLSALPVNANGKVDLAGLRARPVALDDLPAADAPLRSAEVSTLAGIWGQVLGLPVVPVDADFFDLGGDSLQAVRMISLVEQACHRRVPLQAFIAAPTITGLAAALAAPAPAEAPPLFVPMAAGDDGAPLILLPPVWGSPSTYMGLVRHLGSPCPVYAAHLVGLTGEVDEAAPFAAFVAAYVSALRAQFPGVAVRLGGYSSGGLLAFEVARRLEQAGERVEGVFLIDTYTTRRRSGRSPWRQRLLCAVQCAEVASGLRIFALLGAVLGAWRVRAGARTRIRPTPGEAETTKPIATDQAGTPAPTAAGDALAPLTFGEMISMIHHDRARWGPLARWGAMVRAWRIAKRPAAHRRREWLAAMRVDGPWPTPAGDQGDVRRATFLLSQALMAYQRAGRLKAPIMLLKGAQAPTGGIFGWEAHGDVTCVSVPGNPKSLIESPHVRVLAARLAEALKVPPARG